MKTLGIDLSTRQLDLVLVDDDTGRAEYLPVPFVGHKPPFRFTDARAVRPRLNEVIAASSQDGWDSIWLVGVEKPYSQNTDNAWKYGLVVGALLAAIPGRVCVLELPPQEWRQLCGMPAKASKDDVREWALRKLFREPPAGRGLLWASTLPAHWPQDAYDAYCIARACRTLNDRALKEAS